MVELRHSLRSKRSPRVPGPSADDPLERSGLPLRRHRREPLALGSLELHPEGVVPTPLQVGRAVAEARATAAARRPASRHPARAVELGELARMAGVAPDDSTEFARREAPGVEGRGVVPDNVRAMLRVPGPARRRRRARRTARRWMPGAPNGAPMVAGPVDQGFVRPRAHAASRATGGRCGMASAFGFLDRRSDSLAARLEDHRVAVARRHLAPPGRTPAMHRP